MKKKAKTDLLKVAEVARVLNVGKNICYAGALRRELPWRRIGRKLLMLRRSDLEAYIQRSAAQMRLRASDLERYLERRAA